MNKEDHIYRKLNKCLNYLELLSVRTEAVIEGIEEITEVLEGLVNELEEAEYE